MKLQACLLSLLLLAACAPPAKVQTDEVGVRTLLNRYFSTWSARDMDGYASCFQPQSRVFYLARDGKLTNQALTDFLHEQKMAHQEAASPMNEKPLEMKIQGDERVAQAAVTWVLTIGSRQVHGTDFFTLQREGDQWKIVTLVFYGE
ncbi:hypothetical protein BH11VER1_BH11VER1_13020 [soil metagenome]